MNGKKTALFSGFFSLIFLPLSAARVKRTPHKSQICDMRQLHEIEKFWASVGGVKSSEKKKISRLQAAKPAKKKKSEDTLPVMARNEIVLRSKKEPIITRNSERIAALKINYCIFFPECHFQTRDEACYKSHLLCDHQINERGELIGDDENWVTSINLKSTRK